MPYEMLRDSSSPASVSSNEICEATAIIVPATLFVNVEAHKLKVSKLTLSRQNRRHYRGLARGLAH